MEKQVHYERQSAERPAVLFQLDETDLLSNLANRPVFVNPDTTKVNDAAASILDGFVLADAGDVSTPPAKDTRTACVDAVPTDQYKQFTAAGYKVKLFDDVADYDKQMKTNHATEKPEGYDKDWTWKNVDVCFDPDHKMIVVFKNFIPKGETAAVPTDSRVDVPGRFRHEFGHALDAALGYKMQNDPKLQKLYKEEVAALSHSPATRNALGYYLQAGSTGLRETIAGLYSIEHGGGTDQSHVEKTLKSAFSGMLKYMKEQKF